MAKLTSVEIKQGTTPLITAVVDGAAIQDATVYLSLKTRNRLIVKSNYYDNGDVTLEPVYEEGTTTQIGTSVEAQMSQLETLCLEFGIARIEVGWVFEDGTADKSDIGMINISPTLFKGVMAYGKHSS